MRAKQWATWCAMVVLLACAGLARAQSEDSAGDPGDSLDALRQGRLVIWVLRPSTGHRLRGASAGNRDQAEITYREQSASSFGQSASDYGTASSNYGVASSSPTISAENVMPSTDQNSNGNTAATPADPSSKASDYKEQTAGSFGQTSGSFGTASSNHGQTAGTYGQTASTYGTAASNHGQNAGSFGNSLSTIAQAGTSAANAPKPDPLQERLSADLQDLFPELQVQFVDVYVDDLKDDLVAVKGTAAYPDLLIGPLSAEWWSGLQGRFGLAMLQPASFLADGLPYGESFAPEFAILARAPHMETAKAFALWMSEGDSCAGCVQQSSSKRSQDAADVAVSAIGHLLRGENLGEVADPSMADFSPRLGQGMLATSGNGVADAGAVRVEVIQVSTAAHLAIVALRVMVSSDSVFGLAHPLVVLRRADSGAWKVLHVSLNLPEVEQQSESLALANTSPPARAERHAGVVGISQASPLDGDSRPPVPELWWDNGGGAGLQVVEWQRSRGGWLDAHLYLAPDHNPKLQTRVTAQFANSQGRYRWRVWSVGAEGEMKISPWRTLNILPK
ncbi:hypothetical protein [Granulicella mallensis]|uniref:Uncharacterized protein n=1 Tax=Granulicella mallensis (strain ATCC BAA-1857 / DSM 23137 / MP5ACTX8) TaxID=682795 RepID=G8NU83_GRAMM|nr:hypothetical protein [Granulicella mallensis]AEU38718.1 hypothetical protein AciX8_4445 [Granulicella mallensis MP5ACTX8]